MRYIRARLAVRGFKDRGKDDLMAYAGTAMRWSQRLLVSEAVLRRWPLCALDVKKAFLQGVSYEELAAETGETQREVNFELPASTAAVLRQVPGYESFDHRTEVLHCDKPGTGLRDAPRAFSQKLRKVTDQFGFRGTTADLEHEYMLAPSEDQVFPPSAKVDKQAQASEKEHPHLNVSQGIRVMVLTAMITKHVDDVK